MKIKTKITTEVEKEVQVPAYFKDPQHEWYYAMISDDRYDPNGGVIVREKEISIVYAGTIADVISDKISITEHEFNAASEKVLHLIQTTFYQHI
jgi:hypothetical protein